MTITHMGVTESARDTANACSVVLDMRSALAFEVEKVPGYILHMFIRFIKLY